MALLWVMACRSLDIKSASLTAPVTLLGHTKVHDSDPACVVSARVMHDEVSDTENIRKNLAIERMIVEGCDILLDTSQTFIRQGKSLFSGPPSEPSLLLLHYDWQIQESILEQV